MKLYYTIAAVAVAVIVVTAIAIALKSKKETFRETVQTKYEKYAAMLKARLPPSVQKSEALALLRQIHESEATKVRNPNAKRLHNAAIQRIGDAIDSAYGSTTVVSKSALVAAL